ncbi:ribosomal protein S18 [Clathrospora elynae]|uniref:Small ribosomal subunit protein bS18m n=1 Tax=Clathrospora elynae TaxID=706981 RepID=A0A6A5SPG8_9PLEO|nr:ribosomal protein S18 [Clathrospora elynae]
MRIAKSHDHGDGSTLTISMSIIRTLLRVPVAGSRPCTRCFSSGPPKQDDALLSILGSSNFSRQPASTNAPRPGDKPSLATRFGLEAGLNRASTPSREILESDKKAQYQRQIYRKWQPGDVYAPHDLSGSEQKKWKFGRKRPQEDAFDILGVNPVLEYKNFTIMSEYMTETGRIKHSKDTGLRPKNQRRIAKAIRRAIGLGLMPSVHRHPLVLKRSTAARFM